MCETCLYDTFLRISAQISLTCFQSFYTSVWGRCLWTLPNGGVHKPPTPIRQVGFQSPSILCSTKSVWNKSPRVYDTFLHIILSKILLPCFQSYYWHIYLGGGFYEHCQITKHFKKCWFKLFFQVLFWAFQSLLLLFFTYFSTGILHLTLLPLIWSHFLSKHLCGAKILCRKLSEKVIITCVHFWE